MKKRDLAKGKKANSRATPQIGEPSRQIIALGGGGFSEDPKNAALDLYILEQVPHKRPKVCFLPTASGDSEKYIKRFYSAFNRYKVKPSHLSLFQPPTNDLRDFILEKDIIYVGGGNTKNMLLLWRAWRVDSFLKAAYDRGVVLAGISAGAICWFEEGLTDSIPGTLTALECLGLIKGSFCPHFDREPERQPAYRDLILAQRMRAGFAVENDVALHFVNSKLYASISARKSAQAYFIEKIRGNISESKLRPKFLSRRNRASLAT